MFQLDDIAKQNFQREVDRFHQVIYKNRLGAKELEELLCRAIDGSPEYANKIQWEAGSNKAGADFDIIHAGTIEKVSVKSGTWKNKETLLHVHGNRLTSHDEDLGRITEFLVQNRSDVTLSTPEVSVKIGAEVILGYELVYIPKEAFVYPTNPHDWVRKIGRTGKATYHWKASSGFQATIHPTMSWQVWWKIPRSLCVVESFIPKRTPQIEIPDDVTSGRYSTCLIKKLTKRKKSQKKIGTMKSKSVVEVNYDLPEIPFDRDAEVSLGLRMSSPWGPLVVEEILVPRKFKVRCTETGESKLITASPS